MAKVGVSVCQQKIRTTLLPSEKFQRKVVLSTLHAILSQLCKLHCHGNILTCTTFGTQPFVRAWWWHKSHTMAATTQVRVVMSSGCQMDWCPKCLTGKDRFICIHRSTALSPDSKYFSPFSDLKKKHGVTMLFCVVKLSKTKPDHIFFPFVPLAEQILWISAFFHVLCTWNLLMTSSQHVLFLSSINMLNTCHHIVY